MRHILLAVALAVLACERSPVAPGTLPPAAKTTPKTDAVATVDVVPVVARKLETIERLPAELAPWEVVAIYPKVLGFVEEIRVDRGSAVRAGQLLVRLTAPELVAQTAQAQAAVRADQDTFHRLLAAARTPGAVSKNELKLAEESLKADQERVSSLRTLTSYLTISAPFDGIITERNVHPGALVGPPNDPLTGAVPMLRIEQITHLRLTVPVPEADAGAIAVGAEVRFQVRAWPDRYFAGTVSRVSHWVDTKTRTMAVEADVYQREPVLDPGMFVEVLWPIRRGTASLFVPATAIVETAEKVFVACVREGRIRQVPVQRGKGMGNLVEVFGPLEAGDLVVRHGSEDFVDGARVTPRTAAQS